MVEKVYAEENMEAGERYEKARIMAGLSFHRADELLGFEPGVLLALEEGSTTAEMFHLDKMAHLYEVRYDWLIGYTDIGHVSKELMAQIREKCSPKDAKKLFEILSMLPLKSDGQ